MNNKTRNALNSLFMIIALAFVIIGVGIELYLISIAGLLLIVLMLVFRAYHIRKLNREIREIKEIKPNETDDTETS